MSELALVQRHRETIEAALDRWLPEGQGPVPEVVDAMRYSLLAGGKRLRPALALSVCEAMDGDLDNVLATACALEMIHTYSLIHDDLPCMDDDDLRRGRKTNHVVYGEAMAVLAGDALSNAAFLLIAEETQNASLVGPLVRELARAAGIEGMIGGQVLDMNSMGEEPTIDRVGEIHRRKTGALIRASCSVGAIAAEADSGVVDDFRTYGESIGLAFQIIDDILDLTSDSATLGKSAGKDLEQDKMTWPACVGLDASRKEARALAERGKSAVAPYDRRGELGALADFICDRIS